MKNIIFLVLIVVVLSSSEDESLAEKKDSIIETIPKEEIRPISKEDDNYILNSHFISILVLICKEYGCQNCIPMCEKKTGKIHKNLCRKVYKLADCP